MKLNICGRKYTVKVTCLADHEAHGMCDSSNGCILIDDNFSRFNSISPQSVLLHEIIHAVLYETGLCHILNKKEEEAVAHTLAIHLSNLGYNLDGCSILEDLQN